MYIYSIATTAFFRNNLINILFSISKLSMCDIKSLKSERRFFWKQFFMLSNHMILSTRANLNQISPKLIMCRYRWQDITVSLYNT